MDTAWRGGWSTHHHRGSVASLHALDVPTRVGRQLWVMKPTDEALVLGSAQRAEEGDAGIEAAVDRAGVSVVRRRSGGGAVLVDPSMLWVDFLVGRGDELWLDDVGRAFEWVGDVWRSVLGHFVSPDRLGVHRGALRASEWSRQICFAGLGPGEVMLDECKVVGVSQRRTRDVARFQCSIQLADPSRSVPELLGLTGADLADATAELDRNAAVLGVERQALLAALESELRT